MYYGIRGSTCTLKWIALWPSEHYQKQMAKPQTQSRSYLVSLKEQVGKDQEKAQSEKDSHSKNRGGKKQTNNQVLIP